MSSNKDNKNYDKLRASYRNFIQITTTECKQLTDENRKYIESVYRQKNVKKSIDSELKRYCETGNYEFDNEYWNDYHFDETTQNELKSNNKIQKFYQDFCNKMNIYFNSENDIKFEPPNFDEIKKYLSPELFTKLQENFNKCKTNLDENGNDEGNDNIGIEFPEFVVDLAKELSNEIEIPPELENISEPSELINKIMQEDGQKMVMNLMNKVTTKLQKKIDNGEINQTQMKQQAEECLQNIMKSNPAMKEMVDQMVNGMGGSVASQYRQTTSKMNTKERLRQKLEKKKQEQSKNNNVKEQSSTNKK